jgi:hypothetical protein
VDAIDMNPQTEIRDRFFKAMRYLIAEQKVKNKSEFALSLGWTVQNMVRAEKSDMWIPIWHVYYICEIYHVNPNWLLLGQGEMFSTKKSTNPPEKRTVIK